MCYLMRPQHHWNKKEDRFLIENCPTTRNKQLAIELKVGLSTIRVRKRVLGLTVKQIEWTKDKLNFLKENSNKLSDREISLKMNISEGSITGARRRYKISKDYSSIRKIMFHEGKIIHPNLGKKLPKKQIEKRVATFLKHGNRSWSKGLKGKEFLKHYGGKMWNKGLTKKTDERVKKGAEKSLKIKKENGSILKGKNHPHYGKTKENCEFYKRISIMMKNGGALKARKACRIKPNKPEKMVISLLEKHDLNLEYTGDGTVWIDRFNPDFISKNNSKKIVEINGEYWHNLPKTKEKDKRKMLKYEELGYDVLILTDKEVYDNNQTLLKIKNFLQESPILL